MPRSIPTFILSFLVLVQFPGIAGISRADLADSGRARLHEDRPEINAHASLNHLLDGESPFGTTLIQLSSLSGQDLTGAPVDPAAVEKEIGRLADRVRPALGDRSDPRKVVAALNRFFFIEEGFVYDGDAGNPENYLLDRVIARRRGNCLGLTSLYLLLAERLSLPLRGVYVPSHSFVRYEDAATRINIETGEQGAAWEDERYVRAFRLTGLRPYLRSLDGKEMIALYLKSLGAAFCRKGRHDDAMRLYGAAMVYYPGLPDVYFNAGVSFHERGLFDEAIAQYRRSLALDLDLVVARDNLAIALGKQGRFQEALEEARKGAALHPRNPFTLATLAAALCNCGLMEDGIREYRKALEVDPDNARALAGLAKAYCALGAFQEAIAHCDRAMKRGWKPDSAMLGALEKHRDPFPASAP